MSSMLTSTLSVTSLSYSPNTSVGPGNVISCGVEAQAEGFYLVLGGYFM